jgi:hypothetical protein
VVLLWCAACGSHGGTSGSTTVQHRSLRAAQPRRAQRLPRDENGTIGAILKQMMDGGPGGGHHDNIVNPQFRLLGAGLLVQGSGLYLTNDFSDSCP